MKNIVDGSNTAKGKNSELENILVQTIQLKKKWTEHQLAAEQQKAA